MNTITIREAKADFSKLIDRVEAGQDVVIAICGEPVAKIVPYSAPPAQQGPRRPDR